MDAFDADVLIYAAATSGHAMGPRVRALLVDGDGGVTRGTGSLLLVPEVLSKSLRTNDDRQLRELKALLAHLDLQPLDEATAELAATLGAEHRLKGNDAVHLATAVLVGADRFITNNRKDFDRSITEIDVVYPDDLPAG